MTNKVTILVIIISWLAALNGMAGQNIVINEVQASNQTTIADEDGDFEDWIELYNQENNPVDLEGYFLSDDENNLMRWPFPPINIPANGYLIIFCSDKDRAGPPFLHSNFKLSSTGEPVFLVKPDGSILDQFPVAPMSEDESFGRNTDGAPDLVYFSFPSPGFSNELSNEIFWSHAAGFYDNAFDLDLDAQISTDTIYYTIDGSDPGQGDLIYDGPITLTPLVNTPNLISDIRSSPDQDLLSYNAWQPPGPVEKAWVVKAVTYKNGQLTSKIATRTFFIEENIFSRFSQPVISISVEPEHFFNKNTGIYVQGQHFDPDDPEWTGNYFQSGQDWERPVFIEMFEVDGDLAFAQNAGIRIHGGKTRQGGQKSFRLFARSEYGKSHFEYPIFPQKEKSVYKRFLIRTPVGSWTDDVIKDAMTHRLVRELDLEVQDYQPASIFINGEYWGLYTLRDFLNKHHLSEKFEVDKDEINILTGIGWVVDGSSADYIELRNFVENNDLSEASNFDFVRSRIDLENYIDYQIIETYFRNVDWPGNNIRYWKANGDDQKWRWLLFDLDAGYYEYDHPTLTESTLRDDPPEISILIRKLLENEDFKTMFYERFFYLIDNLFTKERILVLADSLHNEYLPEMQHQIDRWKFPKSIGQWQDDINFAIKTFAINRPCEMKKQLVRYFNLDGLEFLCPPEDGLSSVLFDPAFILPNPGSGFFQIYYNENPFEGAIDLNIYDVMGRLCYTQKINQKAPQTIHLDFLSSAVYIFEVKDADSAHRGKFIISK